MKLGSAVTLSRNVVIVLNIIRRMRMSKLVSE